MNDLDQLRFDLLSNFFLFTRFIFAERTGRDFIISKPTSNESHFITICRELEDVFYGRTRRLMINCPPGWSKSELVKSFISWAMAHYGDSKFMYISYGSELATSHTYDIKQTMCLPIYSRLFGVSIKRDSSAKDFFKTTQGGAVAAFGSSGSITGHDAGLPGLNRFSGGVFIDDFHKPDEVHSKLIREKLKKNYHETIEPRTRGFTVPIVLIGQRLHQDDIFAHLLSGEEKEDWKVVTIKALDDAGNARYPEVLPKETLLIKKKTQPYVFASQYQQDPIPAGGGLFKTEDFPLLHAEPNVLASFITCDTAETDKEWNDKTVFSFWGLYQIQYKSAVIDDLYAIHWLDCWEMNLEPRDIELNFMDFWASCLRYKVKPQFAIIERKSTGVTLLSVLKNTQGLKVIGVDRTVKSGSKTQRFIDMQQYIGARQVSLPALGKHTQMCLTHMTDITANNTHRFDDIADTCYDAVNAAFIDRIISIQVQAKVDYNELARSMTQGSRQIDFLRKKAYAGSPTVSR